MQNTTIYEMFIYAVFYRYMYFTVSILMNQKKTLGTVTECTEICDDSVSLLGIADLSISNSSGLLKGKERIVPV